MDRQEFERLKEQEKAHLKKVRALKEQLREARQRERLAEALDGLDTTDLDGEFENALRAVREKNVTSEARFELAMEALDDAEARERRRLEAERFEEERRRSAASDLIEKMKADMALGEDAPERHSSQATHGASAADHAAPPKDAGRDPEKPPQAGKTIGRTPRGSE